MWGSSDGSIWLKPAWHRLDLQYVPVFNIHKWPYRVLQSHQKRERTTLLGLSTHYVRVCSDGCLHCKQLELEQAQRASGKVCSHGMQPAICNSRASTLRQLTFGVGEVDDIVILHDHDLLDARDHVHAQSLQRVL